MTPAPPLPLYRQNMQEAEGVTPPRREVQGHGGLRVPESWLPPRGIRVAPQIYTESRNEDVGSDRRNVPWSPENILVDMVARLQQDLVDIRVESRQFRMPGVPPVVPTPRQAAYATTKVPRFGGMTSWEPYRQVFDAIVLSNGFRLYWLRRPRCGVLSAWFPAIADKVVRWSAGATSLSSGTECMTDALRPGAVGMLSPYMYNPVGPCGTLSPSDSDSVGPVGPYGTLSPSDSDSVGPYGMLSLSDPDPVGPVGPCGTLSVSDSDSVGARWCRSHSLNRDLSDAIGMRLCAFLVGMRVIVRLVVLTLDETFPFMLPGWKA